MPETTNPTPAQAIPVPAPGEAPAPAKTAEDKLHERVAEVLAKAAPTTDPPKTEAAVEMDQATLDKLTKASEAARAANQRANEEKRKREEIEASTADVKTLREAKSLLKEGKRIEAMKKLAEVEDPDAEVQALLNEWIALPDKPGEAKLKPEEIEALKADVATVKNAEEKRAAAEKAETDKRNAATFSAQQRDLRNEDGTARYPLASAEENAETAAVVALQKANEKYLKLGAPTMTRQLGEHLMELAYAEIEANLAKEQAKPPETEKPSGEPKPVVRAAVVPRAGVTPAGKKTYPRTPEGAREKLLDAAKAAVEARGGRWS